MRNKITEEIERDFQKSIINIIESCSDDELNREYLMFKKHMSVVEKYGYIETETINMGGLEISKIFINEIRSRKLNKLKDGQ